MARRSSRRQAIRDPGLLEQLTGNARERRGHALDALSLIRREGVSLREAARRTHTTSANVRRWTDSRVIFREGRRWRASRTDTLARVVSALDPGTGRVVPVAARSSEDASRLGRYWNAVDNWRRGATPEEAGLTKFEGQIIVTADGERIELVTDRDRLTQLEVAGSLDLLEGLYH